VEFIGLQVDLNQLFIGDFAANGVLATIQPAGHGETLGRRG
jgi:hypothetical protein